MRARPRLILADDHPMLLKGLRSVLEPELEVVATAADGPALLELALRLRPDVVLADVSMPGIDGIEVARRLRASASAVRVVILSFHDEPSWVRAAFDAGACGYLTKGSSASEIELAVREVLEGRFYVSPAVTRAALLGEPDAAPGGEHRPAAAGAPASGGELTPRERDVVGLVGRGLGNREIARRLGVEVTTVRSHLKSAYEKLGLDGRVGLALYAAPGPPRWRSAVESGAVPPPARADREPATAAARR